MDVDPVAAVENPTVLPATGKTPLRNIRLAEDLWQELKEAAEYEGKTVTEVLAATSPRCSASARDAKRPSP